MLGIGKVYINDLIWDTIVFTISILCALEIVSQSRFTARAVLNDVSTQITVFYIYHQLSHLYTHMLVDLHLIY